MTLSISIVMPVLNEAAGIVPTLAALAPLRARGVEVIVVDGGSSDDTVALATPWADCVLVFPGGRARQMNAGAARATGEVLLFLHADTQLPPGADELVVEALRGNATGDQAIFMRRGLFDAVGGFPDQPLMEDVEISRRLRAVSRPVCLRAKVRTSGRRWESRGVWSTIFLMWRLRWRYWRGEPAAALAEAYR